ncbi:hypothetical protein GS931_11360 [Rhodococcus hoagii]|nr:hypothetical protein [Prescottella equi]
MDLVLVGDVGPQELRLDAPLVAQPLRGDFTGGSAISATSTLAPSSGERSRDPPADAMPHR